MHQRSSPFTLLLALTALVFAGCEATPTTPEAKEDLHAEVQATLTQMNNRDPGLDDLLDRSHGYAIFPAIGKGGLIVGGSYGRGEVYEQGRLVGYADLQAASVGLQAGGQEFAELIVFQTPDAMQRFKSGQFAFTADASAVALKAGAAASAEFREGIAVFTMSKGGLMAEASVGGQRFDFVPLQQELPAGMQQEPRTEQQ